MEGNVDTENLINEAQLLQQYQKMRAECNTYAQNIADLEMEKNEHKLVIDALEPLDGNRRCFRMVGGVLVERTVNEVLPAVKANLEKISSLTVQLNETLDRKEKELTEFQSRYRIRGDQEKQQQQPAQKSKKKKDEDKSEKKAGVLV